MKLVKIERIGKIFDVNTPSGQAQKRFFTIKEPSTNKSYDVGYFLHKTNIDLKVGDEVLMDIEVSKNKDKNGNPYINCRKIELIEKEEIQVPENGKVSQEVWEAKDLRMCRMNALTHAVEIVKMGGSYITEKKLTDNEIRFLVEEQAEALVEFIYGRKSDDLEAPPTEE